MNVDWVRRKALDYGITEPAARLGAAINRLRDPETGRAFVDEMQRFVAPSIVAAMLREQPAGKNWLEQVARIAETFGSASLANKTWREPYGLLER